MPLIFRILQSSRGSRGTDRVRETLGFHASDKHLFDACAGFHFQWAERLVTRQLSDAAHSIAWIGVQCLGSSDLAGAPIRSDIKGA